MLWMFNTPTTLNYTTVRPNSFLQQKLLTKPPQNLKECYLSARMLISLLHQFSSTRLLVSILQSQQSCTFTISACITAITLTAYTYQSTSTFNRLPWQPSFWGGSGPLRDQPSGVNDRGLFVLAAD